MGKRYAIWRRSRIGSALVRVRQPICSERSAMATHLFHRSGLKHYSTIRLLMLSVKFGGISRRKPELEHLPWTAFIRCIWKYILSYQSTLRGKQCSFSDLCIFRLLSSTKSVPMYLVTCWKYKQSHIFISPCRNDPFQLQNCRTTNIFSRFFGTWACNLATTWRNSFFSPPPPNRVCFVILFASSNFSFDLIREALHRSNNCVKICSAFGTCSVDSKSINTRTLHKFWIRQSFCWSFFLKENLRLRESKQKWSKPTKTPQDPSQLIKTHQDPSKPTKTHQNLSRPTKNPSKWSIGVVWAQMQLQLHSQNSFDATINKAKIDCRIT